MKVLSAYKNAWSRRGFVVPVLFGARVLGFLLIAPIIGIALQFAVALSGQSALTDQDIAYFIFSPAGFVCFLLVSSLMLIGTIFAFSAMTVDQRFPESRGFKANRAAFTKVVRRFPALLRYAVELILRVLVIVLPAAGVIFLLSKWLIGAFDINFYLATRPPAFITFCVISAVLVLATLAVLLPKLLSWSLSLHYVLFGKYSAGDAFKASASAVTCERLSLLKSLAAWFALRSVFLVALGAVFVFLLKAGAVQLEDNFLLRFGSAILLSVLWWLSGFIVAAVSVGALAKLLNDLYEGPSIKQETDDESLPFSLSASKALIAVGALAVIVFLIFASLPSTIGRNPDLLVIAHRGAAGSFPENTLPSLEAAVEQGADWVEIDVQETADGEVVVIHDSDLMKIASVNLKIWDATAENLAEIDVGSWFDPSLEKARVPTLAQALEVVRGKAKLLIELKYYGHDVDLEERTAAIVAEAGMENDVAVMSLKYPAVQKMSALRPEWPSGVLAATAVGDLSRLDADFIAVNSAMATPKLLKRARAQGKQVFVWTVNDPLHMMAMISMGVDGLITDEPALANEMIAKHASLSMQSRLSLLFLERLGLTDSFLSDEDLRP